MRFFKLKRNGYNDIRSYKEADLSSPFSLISDDISVLCSAAQKTLSSTHRTLSPKKIKGSRKDKQYGKVKAKSQLLYDTEKEQLLKFILTRAKRELRGIRAYSLLSGTDTAAFTERIEKIISELNLLLMHPRLKYVKAKDTSRSIARTAHTPYKYTYLKMHLKQIERHCREWISLIKLNNNGLITNVDWSVYDVLVGSFGSKEQFEDNLARKYYYAPAAFIKENKMPVKYIALYQSKKFHDAGIRYYGKVTYVKKMKRKKIPFPMRRPNGNEDYYLFAVDEWKPLPRSIRVRDEGVFEPNFTSMFLLANSIYSYELFNVRSAEQFEILRALREFFIQTYIYANKACETYELSNGISLKASGGALYLTDSNGRSILERPFSLSSFTKHPKNSFNMICKYLNIKQKRNKKM